MSLSRYISFMATAIITSLAGAQVVHSYYRPLDDLEDLVQQELKKRHNSKENNYIQSQSVAVT